MLSVYIEVMHVFKPAIGFMIEWSQLKFGKKLLMIVAMEERLNRVGLNDCYKYWPTTYLGVTNDPASFLSISDNESG